jgi:sulfatase modifying factor 1
MRNLKIAAVFFLILINYSCKNSGESKNILTDEKPTSKIDSSKMCCESKIPSRFGDLKKITSDSTQNNFIKNNSSHAGMVWIKGGTFMMGADNVQASPDEYPKHKVTVTGFWMDVTEVTNDQFEKFVHATGYVTTAEKDVDWNELKKQVRPGTPKPPDSMLMAASLVFHPATGKTEVDLTDFSQWWKWKRGANWRHPQGPESNIKGKGNFPVVQVSWDDAIAFCKWSDKRLPTEAEWEYASRGGLENNIYSWGNEPVEEGRPRCNFWQGNFPVTNELTDKFYGSAPVKSFLPNGYGLYDISGNVWEWCSDWYRNDYYQKVNSSNGILDPKGPDKSYDPAEPFSPKRVTRGGSFLCNENYCSGYRCARRMKSSPDTGLEHLGFRCVNN